MGIEDQAQEREIDGFTYRVNPLPFGAGRKVLMRVLRVLGPVIVAAADGGSQAQQGAAVLATLPQALSDADLDHFAKTFGDASFYRGGGSGVDWVPLVEQNQEQHFAGRYAAFTAWLLLCLEVNYAGFFTGGVLKDAVAKIKTLVNPKANPTA